MSDQAPLLRKEQANLPSTGATADYDQSVGEAPFDGTVTAVTYTPEAQIVGADTPATRTLTLVNKGAAGGGTAVVATKALNAAAGTLAAFDEVSLTVDTARDDVTSGDILAFVSTHGGTSGLADPGGLVEVTFSRG